MINENYAVIAGYASIFNNVDLNKHKILKNAFDGSLLKNTPLLWQHDMKIPIGKILSSNIDDIGVYVECAITLSTDAGKMAYSLIKDGIVDSLSIGMQTNHTMVEKMTGVTLIKKAKVIEISIASVPINPLCKISFCKLASEMFLVGSSGFEPPTSTMST